MFHPRINNEIILVSGAHKTLDYFKTLTDLISQKIFLYRYYIKDSFLLGGPQPISLQCFLCYIIKVAKEHPRGGGLFQKGQLGLPGGTKWLKQTNQLHTLENGGTTRSDS